MTPLTVAAVQADPVPGDVPGNVRTAARLVRAGVDRGAALVVLGELFLPAYHPPALRASRTTDVAATADGGIDDPRLDPLRDTGAVVVIGAAVRHPDGRRTCSSLVVDRTGAITVGYDKQQLCGPEEEELFVPGTRGATLTVDGWRFGLAICYDGCFPEHGRAAADDDVHGYLAPSAYLAGSAHRRDVYYAARALDNTMYVVFANSVDGTEPWRFNGGAAIYDPEGRPVTRAADRGEAVVVATLDPTDLSRVRKEHPMLADRFRDLGTVRRQLVA